MELRAEIINVLLLKNVTDLEQDDILLKATESEIKETLRRIGCDKKGRNTNRIKLLKKELRLREKSTKEKKSYHDPWEREFIEQWNDMRKVARIKGKQR